VRVWLLKFAFVCSLEPTNPIETNILVSLGLNGKSNLFTLPEVQIWPVKQRHAWSSTVGIGGYIKSITAGIGDR